MSSNIVFTSIYCVEAAAKIIAYGFKLYISKVSVGVHTSRGRPYSPCLIVTITSYSLLVSRHHIFPSPGCECCGLDSGLFLCLGAHPGSSGSHGGAPCPAGSTGAQGGHRVTNLERGERFMCQDGKSDEGRLYPNGRDSVRGANKK